MINVVSAAGDARDLLGERLQARQRAAVGRERDRRVAERLGRGLLADALDGRVRVPREVIKVSLKARPTQLRPEGDCVLGVGGSPVAIDAAPARGTVAIVSREVKGLDRREGEERLRDDLVDADELLAERVRVGHLDSSRRGRRRS